MKNYVVLFLTAMLVALTGNATISVCGTYRDDDGHFNCPYITKGSITWNETSKTLTLDNAVVEYSSATPGDNVYPIRVTEDATIVIHGDCKLTTTSHVAISLDGYSGKNITIQGDGSLYTSSSWIDIFLVCTHLTIKDITLETNKGIANNSTGTLVGLTFDHVQATVRGDVGRIGDGITFMNCSITYPEDSHIGHTDYGDYIYYGNDKIPEYIIITRKDKVHGDVNGDGEVTIADVNYIINAILKGTNDMNCDVNGDKEVNIADVNAVIYIILGGGSAQGNHEYVNLGLPSGTLWATCNVGASSPEESGTLFAWGETEPIGEPNWLNLWGNYKWCNGSPDTMTKYCTDSEYGTVDNLTELEPEDDAAWVNWGPMWRMPSEEQLTELEENCTWKMATKNGVPGRLVTGPNGNYIFLPTAEDYWSRNLNPSISFYALGRNFEPEDAIWWHMSSPRNNGHHVRAVRVQ